MLRKNVESPAVCASRLRVRALSRETRDEREISRRAPLRFPIKQRGSLQGSLPSPPPASNLAVADRSADLNRALKVPPSEEVCAMNHPGARTRPRTER